MNTNTRVLLAIFVVLLLGTMTISAALAAPTDYETPDPQYMQLESFVNSQYVSGVSSSETAGIIGFFDDLFAVILSNSAPKIGQQIRADITESMPLTAKKMVVEIRWKDVGSSTYTQTVYKQTYYYAGHYQVGATNCNALGYSALCFSPGTTFTNTLYFTPQLDGGYKVNVYVFNVDQSDTTSTAPIITDSQVFSVATTPTCPTNYCTSWTSYDSDTGGSYQSKTCYTYSLVNNQCSVSAQNSYRAVCNTGYVAASSSSCVPQTTTPPPTTPPVTPPPTTPTTLAVDIQTVNAPASVIAGQTFSISGSAKVTGGTASNAVIESGINYYGVGSSTQSVLTLTSAVGACGDDQTVGVKFSGQTNDIVNFQLVDKAPTTPGSYRVRVVAVDRCSSAGTPSLLDEYFYNIIVTGTTAPPVTPPATTPDTTGGSTGSSGLSGLSVKNIKLYDRQLTSERNTFNYGDMVFVTFDVENSGTEDKNVNFEVAVVPTDKARTLYGVQAVTGVTLATGDSCGKISTQACKDNANCEYFVQAAPITIPAGKSGPISVTNEYYTSVISSAGTTSPAEMGGWWLALGPVGAGANIAYHYLSDLASQYGPQEYVVDEVLADVGVRIPTANGLPVFANGESAFAESGEYTVLVHLYDKCSFEGGEVSPTIYKTISVIGDETVPAGSNENYVNDPSSPNVGSFIESCQSGYFSPAYDLGMTGCFPLKSGLTVEELQNYHVRKGLDITSALSNSNDPLCGSSSWCEDGASCVYPDDGARASPKEVLVHDAFKEYYDDRASLQGSGAIGSAIGNVFGWLYPSSSMANSADAGLCIIDEEPGVLDGYIDWVQNALGVERSTAQLIGFGVPALLLLVLFMSSGSSGRRYG